MLVDGQVSAESVRFYNELDSFSQRLAAHCRESTVVLPYHDPSLVGRALLLRPRFLIYLDQ
ncbi:hypothetical protein DFAR_170002 [Desulfarculales bacterium]